MPEVLLTESIAVEMGSSELWPDDVKLFQTFEVEQIILPDVAAVRSVQAFLQFCKLNYAVEQRANAIYMSPSQQIPFIKCGPFVIAEMDPIVAFINTKGFQLSEHLSQSEKADMRAYMSLVNNILESAELYISWCHEPTFTSLTSPRYSWSLPWPLDRVLTYLKKRSVFKKLDIQGWSDKTLQEVYNEVDSCCQALAERLGAQEYFFGQKLTELDALVFGHVSAIRTTPLPDDKLRDIVNEYSTLIEHHDRIAKKYFGGL